MYNKIIFLDIDGVLNSVQWSEKHYCNIQSGNVHEGETDLIDPHAVNILYDLCKSENIGIVLSSSWRCNNVQETLEDLDRYIDFNKLNEFIIGITPRSESRVRGKEIQWWLEHYTDIKYSDFYTPGTLSDPFNWCILDDDSDMLDSQMMNFIHVSNEFGITDNTIGQIKNILNRIDLKWTNIKE